MSKNIEANSAKLAGLQIDLLQKYRAEQITLDHLAWFNKLSREQRDMLSGCDLKALVVAKDSKLEIPVPEIAVVKFALFADLGIITVPANYKHATQLARFRKKNYKKFYYYNDDINDKKFAGPTTILVPDKRIHVRVFKQTVAGTTTSEERLAFLKSQNSFHLGAQGASLVFEQKRDLLPKGYWYASMDEKENLWQDSDGYRRVPCVRARSDGDFVFNLGSFENSWDADYCLLCFCLPDMPSESWQAGDEN